MSWYFAVARRTSATTSSAVRGVSASADAVTSTRARSARSERASMDPQFAGEPLGAERPDRAVGGVAQLDTGGDQAVTHTVSQRVGLLRPKLSAQLDESLDQWRQQLLRVTQTLRGGFAQAMHERVEHGAGAVGLVRLQRVGRPLEDGAIEVEDRLD